MRKSKLYRLGALFMAVLMVVTCVPQTALYASAEEGDAVTQQETDAAAQQETEAAAQQETEAEVQSGDLTAQTDEEYSIQEGTDGSSVQTSQESGGEITPQENDGTDPAPIPVQTITMIPDKLTIQRKDTAEIKYTIFPSDATDKTVTFTNSNPDAVDVAPNGTGATLVAKAVGTATITATTANGLPASCVVEVTPIPVTGMTVTPDKLEMTKGGTTKVSVSVTPDDADNKKVILGSYYDSKVITATYNDTTKELTVKAEKGGYTTLTLKSDDNDRVYKNILVEVDEGEVKLTGLTAKAGYPTNLYEGDSINLKRFVTYTPGDATDKELVWSVDGDNGKPEENPARKYVDVSQNGGVTAKWDETDKNVEKEVTIVAASKTYSSIAPVKFTIKIKRNNVPLKALYVDPAKLVLEDAGDRNQGTIGVQLDPLASTDKRITATVSGTGILINEGGTYKEGEAAANTVTGTADVNGWVYFTVRAKELEEPKKQAACTITFAKEGTNPDALSTIKAKCEVTINKRVEPVEKLELPEFLEMTDGSTENLTAVIGPLRAEDKNIVWTVDDPEIASIVKGVSGTLDADGKIEAALDTEGELSATVQIKANMVGTCTITATAAGGVQRECKVSVTKGANPATGLKIKSDLITGDTTEITLKPGKKYTLKPEITPEDADNKKVKWTSGSPTVASVEKGANEAGVVTANELGQCIITARASGDTSDCTKEVQVYVKNPLLEAHYKGDSETWSYTPADQPITEEMLRKELDVIFYPRENPIPEEDKQSLGSSEKNNYELRILREDGKTEKEYAEADLEKAGTRTLVISYTYEGKTYKDTVAVTMNEFEYADLISVTPLSGEDADIWNVPNATSAVNFPLPETTEITVGREITVEGKKELKISRRDAGIEWNVEEIDYDPTETEAQEFKVIGNVVLPDGVSNPENISLRVEATVHVREWAFSGKKMAMPKFSVLGGKDIGDRTAVTLPYGTKIEISPVTEVEDIEIYYMLDRRPDEERGIPHDAAHQYKSPIEVTSKTTTIYAIAAKRGYDDSGCSECTIKLVAAEDIDPDDPDAGPLPDDVTDEDRAQIGGSVPNGLWAVVQMDADEKREGGFAYTGTAIKPAVHVYDRTMLLTEKTDYTIAYSNNVNAGSAVGSAKPPTITVTGRGNYEGKAVVHFTIKPQSIKDEAVFMDEHVAVAYNKKAQKPNPSLSWNGKKLSKNKDYTYTDVSYTEPGIYKVTVEGIGNYTGTRTMDYEIYQGGVDVSKLTVSKVANQKYTGSPIRPAVTVKNKNVVLFEGTEESESGNYWVKYENCTEVGTASVVIVGKGGYKGSKRINFKILPVANISKAGITLDVAPAGVAYTGKPHTPKCTVNYLGTELKENKDYKLSYQNNNKAGTATVVITGMSAYTGTAKKTFRILQNDISGHAAVMGASYVYEKGGCMPKPEVTCNGLKLKEGTDYTLTYKNNNKIGNTASVTVKGKGNYKGQIVRYFEVTMQDISKLKVVASDRVYQQKKNIYKTKVQVIDLNGKALVAGIDYAQDVYYTYESGEKAGQPVLSTDIIPVGTVIGVDVRVANPRCYQGTVHGTYRIVRADVGGAKVSIDPQEYTGRSIRPNKSQIQVTLNGVLLGNNDYEIVGYENNVKQGNAKITIRGVGSYGGTKTATFKIKKKGILNLKF